jgi:hypothetical protein
MSLHRPLDPRGLLPTAGPRRSHWRMHAPVGPVSHRVADVSRDAAPVPQARIWEPPIVAQARDIIDIILADPDPSLLDIQHRLREKVADYPGFPHKALLAHLLETRQRATPESAGSRSAGRARRPSACEVRPNKVYS